MQTVERDYQIIEAVGSHRVLTPDQIQILFPSDPVKVATNRKNGKATSQYLLKQRMPFLEAQGLIIISKGEPTLYTLAAGGAKWLREQGIRHYGDGKYTKPIKSWPGHARALVKGLQPEGQTHHLLMASQFLVHIRHLPIKEIFYTGERKYRVTIPDKRNFAGIERTMIPDMEIHLEDGRILFVECERTIKEAERNEKILCQFYYQRHQRGLEIAFVWVTENARNRDMMAKRGVRGAKKSKPRTST